MKLRKIFQDPRKRNIFFASAASLAVAGLGTYLYASRVEARRYHLDSLRVDTTGNANKAEALTADCELLRLRILHLSDLHLCRPESHKIDFLRRATESQYDLIVITGDIFEDYSGIPYASQIISHPPRLGAYAVYGNHDFYAYNLLHRTIGGLIREWYPPRTRDVTPMTEALEAAGIHVLRNSCVSFPEEKLHIVGLDFPDISDIELFSLVSQAGTDHLVLVLMHMPDDLARLHRAGVHLALAGHTHGGQVRLPLLGPLLTNSELSRHEASGLIWRGTTAIHISRGVGADPFVNFRLFCPPHGSIIEVCHRK